MPTHPPSSQSYSGPRRELGHLSSSLSTLGAPPRDVQLEAGGGPPRDFPSHDKPEAFPQDIGRLPAADPGTFVSLTGRLRLSLPPGCRWFGPEVLRVIGTCPVDAGGFADLWVGEMDDRKVAVKSYRCYSSASCTPTYKVGHSQPFCALCLLTSNR